MCRGQDEENKGEQSIDQLCKKGTERQLQRIDLVQFTGVEESIHPKELKETRISWCLWLAEWELFQEE